MLTNSLKIDGHKKSIFKFNSLKDLMRYAQTCTLADKQVWEYLSDQKLLKSILEDSSFDDFCEFINTPLLNNFRYKQINKLKMAVCEQAWQQPAFVIGLLNFFENSSLKETREFINSGFTPKELSAHYKILEAKISENNCHFNLALYCCYVFVIDDVNKLEVLDLTLAHNEAVRLKLTNVAASIRTLITIISKETHLQQSSGFSRFINFSRLNLAFFNFNNLQMPYAKLISCNLNAVCFANTNLAFADLTGSCLRNASIKGSNFEGAILAGVSFIRLDYFMEKNFNAELNFWVNQLQNHPQADWIKNAIVRDIIYQLDHFTHYQIENKQTVAEVKNVFGMEEKRQILEAAYRHPLFQNSDAGNYIWSFFSSKPLTESKHQKMIRLHLNSNTSRFQAHTTQNSFNEN